VIIRARWVAIWWGFSGDWPTKKQRGVRVARLWYFKKCTAIYCILGNIIFDIMYIIFDNW
jgi:hypothetical protein